MDYSFIMFLIWTGLCGAVLGGFSVPLLWASILWVCERLRPPDRFRVPKPYYTILRRSYSLIEVWCIGGSIGIFIAISCIRLFA